MWNTLENGDKQLVITEGSTVTLPDDWNPSANTVECYGAGANGYRRMGIVSPGGDAAAAGGGGAGWTDGSDSVVPGGGGAYASLANSFTAGASIAYHIGVPGDALTWFGSTSDVLAVGSTTRFGGSAALCAGSVKHRGGNGHFDGLGGGGGGGPVSAGGDADEDGNPGSGGGGLAGIGGTPGLSGTTSGARGAIVVTYTP